MIALERLNNWSYISKKQKMMERVAWYQRKCIKTSLEVEQDDTFDFWLIVEGLVPFRNNRNRAFFSQGNV